jgi:hypothetical protein
MRDLGTFLCKGVLGVALMAAAACSKKSPQPLEALPDPEFDKQWTALAERGVEALYIEDDRGEGLMGNVRRATKPPPMLPPTVPTPETNDRLPDQPSGEEVQRVIRSNLAAVRSCYMMMARSGVQRSGKAIVSFVIGADGKPAELRVDAPQFRGTTLPNCVMGQVARWSFPKSRAGGGAVSYPFVFVGG